MSLSITIDEETLAKLDASASFRSLSREAMLKEAIDQATAYDKYYLENVEAGIRDADEGRVISAEQMEKEAQALLSQYRN